MLKTILFPIKGLFRSFVYEHTLLSMSILSGVGIFITLWHLSRLSDDLTLSLVRAHANTLSSSLVEIRNYYSDTVVARLEPYGIPAVHDYREHAPSIPGPATMTIELSERINRENYEAKVRLYSSLPFPNREGSPPLDRFEQEALHYLVENPDEIFDRVEWFDGKAVFRHAMPMVMGPGCVSCHNNHPESPKTDWKVGDVRGNLEVSIPMVAFHRQAEEGLYSTLLLVSLFIGLGVLTLGKVLRRLRSSLSDVRDRNERLTVLTETFEKFVPRQFLDRISTEGPGTIRFGYAESEVATVLFSDIRAFTTLSEGMSSRDLLDFLNDYFRRMNAAIVSQGGFVDKFVGDGIMALFVEGDPLRAAALMQEGVADFNRSAGERSISVGIGLHRGPVVVGTVGSHDRMDSTVLGDTVNVASRLESLTKHYRSPLLFSGAVFESLPGDPDFPTRELDFVSVAGKREPVRIYEALLSGWEARTLSLWGEALAHYKSRRWGEASRAFESFRSACPGDEPARIYLLRCRRFLEEPPEEDWDGIFRLQHK